jgi:hypothetical protein
MFARRPDPTCLPCVCRTAAAALVVLFVAGVGTSPAQQATGALAVSVTVVRSATIEIPTSALLSGGVVARTAATAITIKAGTAPIPAAQVGTPLPAASGPKNGVPVLTQPAPGRTPAISIQF